MSNNTNNIKVAVRVRPLITSEIQKGCQDVIDIIDPAQVVIKSLDKAFTFSYAFGAQSQQSEVYDKCVKHMIDQLFKGYNVTILAYGQTGSGKTHSMGTNYNGDADMGVIPRAVQDIFNFIKDNFTMDINVSCSFVELYNEVLFDLLSEKSREHRTLEIREDTIKGFHIPGITEIPVSNSTEVLTALAKGSIGRATAQTNMNTQSSRSHAIFTISIFMQNKNDKNVNKMAKLHLVDLAGSERQKKTGAVGTTLKEGININRGLFALGNVISCLGEENKQQSSFIPYRESNLTKLLKDSLGGNSYTLMIACVSPADYNTEETLSTLRYADKALKIKNNPVVNEDPKTAEINALKKTIQQLKLQLVAGGDPTICPAEIEQQKKEIAELKMKNHNLTIKLSTSLQNNSMYIERILALQNIIENSNKKILELREQYNSTINNITLNVGETEAEYLKNHVSDLAAIKKQLESFADEQKLVETEIKQQERIVFNNLVNDKPSEAQENGEEIPQEIHEKQEVHATKQINLNMEIQAISNELCIKQHLVEQLALNSAHIVDYNAIAENEAKIEALQKERDELVQQLKNLQHDRKSNNLAEQRRKRVQDLEGQINGLKKKLQEQSKLIQMKEKDLQRVNVLNKEIAELKQVRVKLLKSMQEDQVNFTKWKRQREQELQRLKNEGRKKETAMAKMQIMHQKQQNVLKRKVEQAVAANKRLQESLALRTKVREAKNNNGNVRKLCDMLKEEFEFRLNIMEAKAALDDILEERADLQHQLDGIKTNGDGEENLQAKANLEQQIELRTLQIQDLQQKIIDSDEDKSKFKFDNIQSMAEAKFALKFIFDQALDKFKQDLSKTSKLSELEDAHAELNGKVEELSNALKESQEKHAAEVAEIEQKYEEKISILLADLRGTTPVKKTTKMKKKIVRNEDNDLENKENELEESIFDIDDDITKDPDWHKTPLAKRIRQEKENLFLSAMTERAKTKRSLEAGCTCKTNCNNRCGCKKLNRPCSSNCKCDASTCLNMTNSEGDTFTVTEENSFKKPRKLICLRRSCSCIKNVEFKDKLELDAAMEESSLLVRTSRRTRQIFTHST